VSDEIVWKKYDADDEEGWSVCSHGFFERTVLDGGVARFDWMPYDGTFCPDCGKCLDNDDVDRLTIENLVAKLYGVQPSSDKIVGALDPAIEYLTGEYDADFPMVARLIELRDALVDPVPECPHKDASGCSWRVRNVSRIALNECPECGASLQ
jgi:hypothetical protein